MRRFVRTCGALSVFVAFTPCVPAYAVVKTMSAREVEDAARKIVNNPQDVGKAEAAAPIVSSPPAVVPEDAFPATQEDVERTFSRQVDDLRGEDGESIDPQKVEKLRQETDKALLSVTPEQREWLASMKQKINDAVKAMSKKEEQGAE